MRVENETNFSPARCLKPRRFLMSLVRVILALSYACSVSLVAVEAYILSEFPSFIQTSSHIKMPLSERSLIQLVISQHATGYPWAPSTQIMSNFAPSSLARYSEFSWMKFILLLLARFEFLSFMNDIRASSSALP